MKLIDIDTLVAEIEKYYNVSLKRVQVVDADYWNGKADAYRCVLTLLDTIEVKEVIAEQECTCNEALNRIIGGSWNLLCPINKLGLKTGDKVKVIIKAQKESNMELTNKGALVEKINGLPKKYETCDWLFIYYNFGLTAEHVKRLTNAINILKIIGEHTDAKFLKEIQDKLLEVKEVKEVDLEKEFESFLDNIEGVPRMWHSDEQLEWAKDIAKHFFELGLKAQKGE